MLDPFPVPPPRFLVTAIKPFSDALNLHSLPLHAHEIIFATLLYFFTEKIISPWISNLFFPHIYSRLSRKGRLNWDVHVVSFVQSCLINALSLYIIWFDEERKAWRSGNQWENRIWGYYGSGGLAQSFALGYFLWDLYTCTMNVEIFGWGMLAHAVSAVAVFGLGYRPFIYFTAPIFLLYELSSPFLNIHWFCDKLNLTGSIYQAINGVFLVTSFFGCRLVWGTWNSILVFRDMIWALKAGHMDFAQRVPGVSGRIDILTTNELLSIAKDPVRQLTAFNREQYIPLWIPLVYLASNIVLNSLNVFWFGKMIETIRTRFDPPWGTKGLVPDRQHPTSPTKEEDKKRPRAVSISQLNPEGGTVEEEIDLGADGAADGAELVAVASATAAQKASPLLRVDSQDEENEESSDSKKKGSVRAARAKAEQAMNGPVGVVQDTKIEQLRSVDSDVDADVAATGSARKSARSRRKG